MLLLFACLPSLSLAGSSTLLLRHPLAGVRTLFFKSPVQTEDQRPLGILQEDPSTGLGLLGHPASRTEQLKTTAENNPEHRP